MKTPEDEAFDDIAKRQGDWGGGFPAKKAMAADKLQEPPSEWAGIKAILDEYGLQAIDFVADFKAALAQPAQEPVAWAIYDKRGGSKSLHWPENHCPDGDATKFDAVPLYTTPPQREWVGLTDEERSKIWGGIIKYAPSEMRIKDFAQAIEAKLKEKNT